jgi:chromate transport protein ChrA
MLYLWVAGDRRVFPQQQHWHPYFHRLRSTKLALITLAIAQAATQWQPWLGAFLVVVIVYSFHATTESAPQWWHPRLKLLAILALFGAVGALQVLFPAHLVLLAGAYIFTAYVRTKASSDAQVFAEFCSLQELLKRRQSANASARVLAVTDAAKSPIDHSRQQA